MSKTFARWATSLAVLAVATIAAIVSYTHIQTLALSHGYTPGTASLLPFSVDGLIVASSLALANGAWAWLARTGLVLGVLTTVAATVAFCARFGLVGEIISAWTAGAFLVSSEILLSMLRARPAADQVEVETVTDIAPVIPVADGTARTVAPRPAPTRTAPKRKPAPEKLFAADIEAGKVPSIRAIKDQAHVGTARAQVIREQLLGLVGNDMPNAV